MRALGPAAVAASCLLPLWPAACPAAVDAGGSVALTSDDVYRGVSMTCGHPAAQADVHARELGASGWAAFVGVWGSAGLSDTPCGSARELDFYAGYNVALSADLSATFTYTRYAFPGGDYANPHLAGERYDYDQLATSWDIMDRLYLNLAWTPDAIGYEQYEGEFQTDAEPQRLFLWPGMAPAARLLAIPRGQCGLRSDGRPLRHGVWLLEPGSHPPGGAPGARSRLFPHGGPRGAPLRAGIGGRPGLGDGALALLSPGA